MKAVTLARTKAMPRVSSFFFRKAGQTPDQLADAMRGME
jgi:hypothetical protein